MAAGSSHYPALNQRSPLASRRSPAAALVWPQKAAPRGNDLLSPCNQLRSDRLSPSAELGNCKFPQILYSQGSTMCSEDEHGVLGGDAACTGGFQPPRLQRSQGQVASDEPLASTGRFGSLGEPQMCILQQNCPGLCPHMEGTGGAPRGLPRRVEVEPAPGWAQDQGDGVRPSVTH